MGHREDIERALLEGDEALPTTTFGRLTRTASAALRGRRALARASRGKADAADLQAMVSAVGRLKGIAMKMGQIMSYIDVALPPEVRDALAALQTHSQPMAIDRVRAVITAELGEAAGPLLGGLEATPVAAASIGQVHRATLPDGRRVAVKVQYPEIEAAIASDFRPAAFGQRMASLFYPGADIRPLVQEARERFLAECDYRAEAAWQARFGVLFRDHPVIAVPAVLPELSARRVLTSTWVDGQRFEAFLAGAPDAATRDRLGTALFQFYVDTLFRHGLYNCDPHPGNYLFGADGRLTILDYGCARAFSPDTIAALAGLTRAVHADDRDQLHAAFVALGMVREGRRYDFDTARQLVRGFYGPMLQDRTAAIAPGEAMGAGDIVASKRKLMKLSLPGEFLFLFRIRFGLMSVLSRLGARANWYRLERAALDAAP